MKNDPSARRLTSNENLFLIVRAHIWRKFALSRAETEVGEQETVDR